MFSLATSPRLLVSCLVSVYMRYTTGPRFSGLMESKKTAGCLSNFPAFRYDTPINDSGLKVDMH